MPSTGNTPTERQRQKPHPLSIGTKDTVARSATMASPVVFRESPAVSPVGSCRSLPTPQRLFTSLNTLAIPRSAGARTASEEDETEPSPQIQAPSSTSEPEQRPKPPIFDLDSPYLPLHAASLQHGYVTEFSGVYVGGRSNELVCRFRAAHRPPYLKNLSDPLDFASYGEVVTDTSDHLHLRVRFEHLHMVHAIKQAWVERHLRPDDTCILRLGDPVLNASTQSLDLTKTAPGNLLEALMPRRDCAGRVGDSVVGQHSPTLTASPGPGPLSANHADIPSKSVEPDTDKDSQVILSGRPKMADASTQTEEQKCSMTTDITPVVPAEENHVLVPTIVEVGTMEESNTPATAAETLAASRLTRLSPKKVKSWADIARRT